ncbi:MAG: RNA polymerase sigma factor [Mesonia hippocampi]|uniref:RNA polymerase sigma factor n=1 Tax=Mesonia hippocampi TaxID=1628250 RepID=UPI003F9D8B02
MTDKNFIDYLTNIKDLLFRLALRLLVSEDAAKDAVQEISMKLWKHKEKITQLNNPDAYAVTMMKNYCYDQLKLKQHNNLRIEHSNYKDAAIEIQHTTEVKDELQQVYTFLQTLSKQEQTLIQLRDIEQLEYTEIAAITTMKETAIRVALSRARKKIREQVLALHKYGTPAN